MPKVAKKLTAVEVARLGPGFHLVGGVAGLALVHQDTGATSWILRIRIGERRPDIGLGSYPEVSLAKAREQAAEMRSKKRQGIDPLAEKRALQAVMKADRSRSRTFEQCATAFLKRKTVEFRNAKHAAQWEATIKTYANPVIGNLPVDHIALGHITRILEPIWSTKTETATRLRQRIEAVLDYATASGYRSGKNPAAWKGNLDAILPKPKKLKTVKHHAAVSIDDMPAFWARLRVEEGQGARALSFAILTAARSGEVRGAAWSEIDLKAKTWTIPAARMKAQKEHAVPLPPAAVKLLEALPRDNDLVFPAPRGGMLSDMTLSAVLKRMNVKATVHGFRSTFRDWAAERTAHPNHVAEMALAHPPGAVERAYRRGDLLDKRRLLMRDWERFIATPKPTGNVVGIRA